MYGVIVVCMLGGLLALGACGGGGDGGADAGSGPSAGSGNPGTGGMAGREPDDDSSGSGGNRSAGSGDAGSGHAGSGNAGSGDAGNGHAGSGGMAGGSASMSKTEACLIYARAQIGRRIECDGGDPVADLVHFAAYDGCPDVFFSDGTTRTVEGLLACAQELETFPCDMYNAGFFPPCVTPGTRVPGEACLYPSQCESQDCYRDATPCGTCSTRLAPGAACDAPATVCPDGYACNGGTCTANPIAVRETLATDAECQDAALLCKSPDRCLSNGVDTARCTTPIALGDPCDPAIFACQAGTYCPATTRVCTALPEEGEPCASDSPSTSPCGANLSCDRADPNAPVCRPEVVPCSAEQQACGPGKLCCVECPVPSCAPVKQPGESCADPMTTCIPGSECQAGVCEPIDSQGLFAAMCMP